MAAALDPVPFPVRLVSGFTSESAKTLEVYCRDRLFQDVSVFDATERKELFRVGGKGIRSWSLRRALSDSEGTRILDFRHYSLDVKNRWIVEDPDGKKLANIEHVNQVTKAHSDVNATVFGAHNGEDVVVEMRQRDRSALATAVSIEGATIAEISLVADNDIIFNEARGKERTVWRARVAAGVDLALVMVMVMCRAEMAHVWRQ